LVGRSSTNQYRRRQKSPPLKRGGSDPLALRGSVRKLSFMCKSCSDEYYGFLRLKLPGFGSDTLTKEQAAKLAKYDTAAIFTEAEEHMKKWIG
jgi:hypothetical protein